MPSDSEAVILIRLVKTSAKAFLLKRVAKFGNNI